MMHDHLRRLSNRQRIRLGLVMIPPVPPLGRLPGLLLTLPATLSFPQAAPRDALPSPLQSPLHPPYQPLNHEKSQ